MARHPANGGAHRRLGPARTVSSVYEPCAFELRVICLRLRPMTATPSVAPGREGSTTARFIAPARTTPGDRPPGHR